MIRVFLAGEGPSELGSRSGHTTCQSDESPGVVQSLLRAIRPDGWEVVGAIDWRNIRKLRVNAPGEGDARNVHAAAMHGLARIPADAFSLVPWLERARRAFSSHTDDGS